MTTQARTIIKVIPALATEEGAGFLVHRPFPTQSLPLFDPFLLLDEMGPKTTLPGQAKGAPDHPHRGFETVTYLLAGEMEHRDSRGNSGKLTPGDVQWMTAGRGVIHSELPSTEFQERGGLMHGFQLWVNLPARDKMIPAKYQEIKSARIPEAKLDGGRATARVIAGQVADALAVIETRTPIHYIDFQLEPGASIEHAVPADFNAFVYVVEGMGAFGEENRQVARHELGLLGKTGDVLTARAGNERLRFLFIAGRPLNEPVARYGPFVMNTRDEIEQAFQDYRDGRFTEG